jgi:hypothetical protein
MLDYIKEISVFQADIIKSFAIFYLFVVINFVGKSIFTCFEINYIMNRRWLQLTISFLLFYFLVTLISDTGKLELTPPIEKIFNSLFYFFAFLLVMRLDILITMIIFILIFTIYFIELNKEFYLEKGKDITDNVDKEIYKNNQYWITFNEPIKIRLFPVEKDQFVTINKIETILYFIIKGLLVIGFISYVGEIRETLKKYKHYSFLDAILNANICKLKNKKSFLHYLKVGLGIKG